MLCGGRFVAGASQQLTGRRTGTAAAAAAAAAAAKAALQARPVAVQPSAPAQPAPAAAPARRGRGRPRKNPQQAADDAAKRTEVLTVSITVAMKTMDVPLHIFDQLGAWLKLQCSGGIALERGGIFGHAHVQGVAKVVASTPQLVNKMIKASGPLCFYWVSLHLISGLNSAAPHTCPVAACLMPLFDATLLAGCQLFAAYSFGRHCWLLHVPCTGPSGLEPNPSTWCCGVCEEGDWQGAAHIPWTVGLHYER